MVTFAQAQERAEHWVNADVSGYETRDIRVREFDLGFVVWSEARTDGPSAGPADEGSVRVVIARDTGEATLWPALPIGELIRRYEEEYGPVPNDAVPGPPPRVDLEATSFLLSPPQWLQDAADRMSDAGNRGSAAGPGDSAGPGNSLNAASALAGSPGPADAAPLADPPVADQAPAAASPAGSAHAYGSSRTSGDPGDPGAAVASSPAVSGTGSPADPGGTSPADSTPGHGTAAAAADHPIDYRRPGQASEQASAQAQPTAAGGSDPGATVASSPAVPGTGSPEDPGNTSPADSTRGHGTAAAAADGPIDYRRPGQASEPASAPGEPAAAGGIDYRRREAGAAQAPADRVPTMPPAPPGDIPRPAAPAAPAAPMTPAQGVGAEGGWAGKTVSDSGEGQSVEVPATVFAPPLTGADLAEEELPPGADDRTELMPQVSSLPTTKVAPRRPGVPNAVRGSAYPPPAGPAVPLPPPRADAADIADLETAKAPRGSVPPPPGHPGPAGPVPATPPPPPGASDPFHADTMLAGPGPVGPPPPPPGTGTTPPPGAGAPHYSSTLFAGPAGPAGPAGRSGPHGPSGAGPVGPPPPPPGVGTPPPPGAGNPHYAATMLGGPAGPPAAPGSGNPQYPGSPLGGPAGPPPPPGANDPHYAATMLSGPGPLGPPPPPPPPGGGAGGVAPLPPPPPPPPPLGYGYPQQTGVPTVGPGYMAVLRYRGQDGSEQQVIRRSAPGTPHPEWQILHELRSLGVRPEQVLELHTELESCDLPGGYCTRMIRETWPQVRISHTAPYGRDHAGRRQGVHHLLTHQGELHQVAGAPARPQPQRVPIPDPRTVQRVPPVGLEVIGQELAGAFGPRGVFRFDQRAVSRQGVPDIVARTLTWVGLPVDFGPFFWAQAQPGRPVPTLAELAAERGVRPAADAGSYLVMGNDFGRQLCVQYGTAHIVAVPLEAGAEGAAGAAGQPAPAQFVNSSLPEFARCLALLGRMWRLRIGLTPEQAGRWTVDFQSGLAAQDPAAIASPDNWWSVLIEQMWDGLL